MILLEAMCLQVPIIARAVGGIPHLLNQGQCGILDRHQTAKAFSNARTSLINQPEQSQQFTQLALKRVNQRHSEKTTASAYLKIC